MFNDFFNQKCSTVNNSSSVPENISFETGKRLSTFEVSNDDIVKFIRSLDPNKANVHDGILISMLKLCNTSIAKPLTVLYKNCLDKECFPQTWKKAKKVITEKKSIDLSRYCLFLEKKIEKIVFNSLFKHLDDKNLLNSNQSRFRPGDSCVHQLLAITNDIYKAFDTNPSLEVRGVFF